MYSVKGLHEVRKEDDKVAYGLKGGDIEVRTWVLSEGLQVHHSFDQKVLDLANGCPASAPGTECIDPNYLRTGDPELVSGRFLITAGQLYAFDDPDAEWRWVGANTHWHHVAQIVLHAFEINESTLTLWMGPDAEIKFEPKDDVIWVVVGNTTYEDIFPGSVAKHKPAGPSHLGELDVHVRLYFDLSRASYPTDKRPALKRRDSPHYEIQQRQEEAAQQLSGLLPKPTGALNEWIKLLILRLGGSNCPPGLWSG
jgi:hypothetical protein